MSRPWRVRGTRYPRNPAADNTPRSTEPSREAVPGRVTCTVQRQAVLDPPKGNARRAGLWAAGHVDSTKPVSPPPPGCGLRLFHRAGARNDTADRKSTRLNSSHGYI